MIRLVTCRKVCVEFATLHALYFKDLKRGLEEICRLSTDDSHARKTRKSSNKVSFHPTAFVVLIPTSHEYHRAGLGQSLWWDEMDYREFKQSAMNEMKDFVQKYPNADCAQIFKMYYDTLMSDEKNVAAKDSNNPLLSSPSCVVDVEKGLREAKQVLGSVSVPAQLTKTVPGKKLPSPLHLQRTDSVQLYKDHYGEDHEHVITSTGSSTDLLGPPSPVLGEKPLHTSSSSSGPDSPTSPQLLKHCDTLQVIPPPSQNGMLPFLFNAAATMMLSLVQSD